MSYCLNKYCLIISEVQWQSSEGDFISQLFLKKTIKNFIKISQGPFSLLIHQESVLDMYVSVIEAGHHWLR